MLKVMIFGNIASGKTTLAKDILRSIPNLEYISIDDFRRTYGDGSIEKECIAKNQFLISLKNDKPQLIEAMGFGDTGDSIFEIMKDSI